MTASTSRRLGAPVRLTAEERLMAEGEALGVIAELRAAGQHDETIADILGISPEALTEFLADMARAGIAVNDMLSRPLQSA